MQTCLTFLMTCALGIFAPLAAAQSPPLAPLVQPAPPASSPEPQDARPPWSITTDDVGTLLMVLAAAAGGGLAGRVITRRSDRAGRQPWAEAADRAMTGDAMNDRWGDAAPGPAERPDADAPVVQPPVDLPSAATPGGADAPTPVPVLPSPFAAAAQAVTAAALPSAERGEPSAAVEVTVIAVVAPPAAPVPIPGTVDAIRETRASHSHQSWGSFNRDALPQLLFYGGNKFCQFSADRLEAADEWFIIGDIHGDFYALHTIVSFIRKACPGFGIIFLGDLIDRGPHPIECLWYLLKVADDHPNRVLWLAGNHDVGVRFDEEAGRFRSTVEPAEFVADLNIVDSFTPLRRVFGREYIELSQGLPRAAVMPDGLLLTHGGFPHTDLQERLTGITLGSDRRRWLESEDVIRDFTHLRITRYPMRRPNRLSISCSYGYKDFDAFRRSMTGYNVKRLVTGHQHAADGFDDHPDWAKNGQEALTLTGFGFADAYDRPEAYSTHYRRTLVVGRCRTDQLPEVVSIPVDERDLSAFFDAEIATMPRFAAP